MMSENDTLITVHVDYREEKSGIPNLLKESGMCSIVSCPLPYGDYHLGSLLVERKSRDDFFRSLNEGKLFRQLVDARRASRRAVLLLEGFERMQFSAARMYLRNIQLKIQCSLQIPILWSRDINDSAELLTSLAIQEAKSSSAPASLEMSTKPQGKFAQQLFFVAALPGIGRKRAKALLKHFGTPASICQASVEELVAVEGIGLKQAQALTALLSAAKAENKEANPTDQQNKSTAVRDKIRTA